VNRPWPVLVAVALTACTSGQIGAPATTSVVATSVTATTTTTVATTATVTTTTVTTVTTTTVPALRYVFPFVGRDVSYATEHHDYPAADVFGCGAQLVAPTTGVVSAMRDVDLWDSATDNPAVRGGKYVAMVGDDGVRYYVAHLDSVAVAPGQRVGAGDPLGVMGQTGNARNSDCHTHLGISRPCDEIEWEVRRGELWPQPYLDAWRRGEQLSPAGELAEVIADAPSRCSEAAAAEHAGEA
jgi:murein DD-endopeptidase MepM/ murein hydrolase activator NlpD